MPGDDRCGIVVLHQLGANRAHDLFHRRAAEIPAPDRAGKKRISGEHFHFVAIGELETDAAGRVTGRMEHAATQLSELEQISVAQVAVER